MIAEKDINAVVERLVSAAEQAGGAGNGGRHHTEVFDDTEVFTAVSAGAKGEGRISGTLPGMPVVEPDEAPIVDDADLEYRAKLSAVVRQGDVREVLDGHPDGAADLSTELYRDVAPFPVPTVDEALDAVHGITTADLLEVLGERPPGFRAWLYRNLTFPRVAVLALVAGVLLGTGIGWWLP